MPTKKAKDAAAAVGGVGAGKLTVTAQQSRFHTEMDEDNTLKEIVVKDLSISVGARELLSHANLQLQRGRKYVLHGRNGLGKSTLLRAIATDQIPSIPRGVQVLLLGQTELATSSSASSASSSRGLDGELHALNLHDETVLQHVVRGDKRRERFLREANLLTAAFENSADGLAAVKAYRQIAHERLEQRLAEARQIAIRRSGARGAQARKVLNQVEEEVAQSQARVEAEVRPEEMSEESRKAAELLTEVQTSLELMDAAGAEAKARSVLLGLGFSEESIEQPRANLSGGWKTRCSLAAALCQSVDLLLLDEPTNYLDLPSIIWLERYIQSIDGTTTVLVVTHDRAFGDEVAEELLVLREKQLERFRGNLSAYETDRLKTYKYMTRMKEAQDKQKKHIQATIEGNVQAARRAGDDKKLKQAAARKKKLDNRMGLEVSAKGTRFKLNRDLVGYHLKARADIEAPTFDPPAVFEIPTEPADLRFPGSLVSFEKVHFSYTVRGKKVPILKDIDLTIHPGDRIGIAGLNGSGKSTLVSLALGTSATAVPASGTITRHTRARFGLYTQQSVEELDVLAASRPEITALSHLLEHMTTTGTTGAEQDARALLSGLGLAGKTASDVPVALLSGGQKVRLALAKLLWPTPPHLLVLDEVTTHLDTDAIAALIAALRRYAGALLVVTHDRFFMRCVVEGESMKALAARNRPEEEDDEEDEESSSEDEEEGGALRNRIVYRLSKGKLIRLERGMEQYEEIAARSATKLGKV